MRPEQDNSEDQPPTLSVLGDAKVIKVYCETNSMSPMIRSLQEKQLIEIVHFPFDTSRPKKAHKLGKPSAANPEDINLCPEEMDFYPEDFSPSEKHPEIEAVVGKQNRRDICHIDSAYTSGCKCMLTTDKTDILNNRGALEPLLDIRFFHPTEEFDLFQQFLEHQKGSK